MRTILAIGIGGRAGALGVGDDVGTLGVGPKAGVFGVGRPVTEPLGLGDRGEPQRGEPRNGGAGARRIAGAARRGARRGRGRHS